MLQKKAGKKGRVRVKFIVPSDRARGVVHVAGDFNDWQETPLKRAKDGSASVTIELEGDREYQYRYLVDGQHWMNDEAADGYVPNPFGADNCVVRTVDVR